MLILGSTSDLLRVITDGASVDVDVHASWSDLNGTTVTPGRTNTLITTATTTTVVGSPGSSTYRNVRFLAIRNASGSQSVTVTVVHTDGTNVVELAKRVLKAGESLTWVGDQGFSASDGGFFPTAGAALDLAVNDSAGTPAANTARLFGRKLGGRVMPAFVDPSGLDSSLQPLIARNKIGWWVPPGNATTIPAVLGIAALTATGTATARNVAITNFLTQARRLAYVSAATAGSSAGARLAVAQFYRGNVAGRGGFHFITRFGVSDAATVANARMFVGMCAATAVLANAEPSSNANLIGVGCDAGETTLSIMHNDGAGTATKINLGAGFPSQTLDTAYDLTVFCPPNATWVGVTVTNLSTGASEYRELTSDIPADTQLLAFQLWRNNGATALAVGIDVLSIYIETDN